MTETSMAFWGFSYHSNTNYSSNSSFNKRTRNNCPIPLLPVEDQVTWVRFSVLSYPNNDSSSNNNNNYPAEILEEEDQTFLAYWVTSFHTNNFNSSSSKRSSSDKEILETWIF